MRSACITALLLGVAVSSLLAQTPTEVAGPPVPVIDVGLPGGSRCLISAVIGCKVGNSVEQDLGVLLEIVLDARRKHVAYAVVSCEGLPDAAKDYFALPWRLIEIRPRGEHDGPLVTLGLDRATLQAAPGFDHGRWPDMADPSWASQVDAYYRSRGEPARAKGAAEPEGSAADGSAGVAQPPASKAFVHRRLGKLIGMTVVDQEQHPLGEVEDLVLDTGFATVDGVLIRFGGGTPGSDDQTAADAGEKAAERRGQKLVLLPSEALTLDREHGWFAVPCSQAEFEAMALADGKVPALNNDLWRVRGMQLVHRVAIATRAAAADGIIGAAALEGMPIRETYDVSKIERITATIVTVGSVWLGEQPEERLCLRMRGTDGRDRIVYGAPSGFAAQAALGLRAGRLVEVTGSPVMHGTLSVLVAGSIAVEGKTAILRDVDGRAIWAKK